MQAIRASSEGGVCPVPSQGERLIRCILIAALAATLITSSAQAAAKPSPAKHERDVIRFFVNHPKLAATPAGQKVLWRILLRVTGQVRALQAARAHPTPHDAIRRVFGPYAGQALQVAECESGMSVWASNGQYLGLFQMGEYARGRYGHSDTALGQARSAYRYFVDAGRDWSPWSCKPW